MLQLAVVIIGDVLVWNGVPYNIVSVTNATQLLVSAAPVVLAGTNISTDWYIVRKDIIRAPQTGSSVFAIWKPPIGIFDYDGPLGGGNFKLSLSPNASYSTAAVETKNGTSVVRTDFTLQITSLKFYIYVEKMKIPDQVQELPLMEYQVLSKAWQPTVQFSVSPDPEAITIFFQDRFVSS